LVQNPAARRTPTAARSRGAASSDGDDFANRLMVEVQPAARLRCVRTVAGAAPCVRQGRPVLTATDLGMRCRPI